MKVQVTATKGHFPPSRGNHQKRHYYMQSRVLLTLSRNSMHIFSQQSFNNKVEIFELYE